MKILFLLTLAFQIFSFQSCGQEKGKIQETAFADYQPKNQNIKEAYFSAGCFWCVEAIFESVAGVEEVVSGYIGGKSTDAQYDLVGAGYTNHAESVKIYYDTTIVNYETLLKVFFGSHDPTTLNRQGPDFGRQYRSAIFWKNSVEKQIVENYIAKLYEDKKFVKGTITTELSMYEAFYKAEAYHQDFEKRNPNHSYVKAVSVPRLNKFLKSHPELLKKNVMPH